MYINKPLSQVRQEVKNKQEQPLTRPTTRTLSVKPSKSFFQSVTGKVGLGTAGAGLAAGAAHAIANTKGSDVAGEMGGHFHNAFSNIFGLNENGDAVAGTTVVSSTGPIPAAGGKSFPILKDVSPIDKVWKKAISRNKN